MSRFPKRLVDEIGDGPMRRLLESARADHVPPPLVDAAITTVTANAPPAPESRIVPAGQGRGLTRSKLLVLAGLVVASSGVFWASRSEVGSPPQAQVEPTVAPVNMPAPAAPETTTAESAPTTSVADLPNAAPEPPARVTPEANTITKATSAVGPVGPKPVVASADLLREANRLRGQGRWDEAAATYRRVIELGPSSAEAYPADVALGNLELQQGHTADALARYEHALAAHPSGALAEEARWGRARALRALGRSTDERAALEEFRTRHPDSPLASAASKRIAELGR